MAAPKKNSVIFSVSKPLPLQEYSQFLIASLKKFKSLTKTFLTARKRSHDFGNLGSSASPDEYIVHKCSLRTIKKVLGSTRFCSVVNFLYCLTTKYEQCRSDHSQ